MKENNLDTDLLLGDLTEIQVANKEPENRIVVRLKTSSFSTKRGIKFVKEIQYLKRLSFGFNILEDDFSINQNESVLTNLYECEDGIYEVIGCNFEKDWETGNIEDYELKLVPYKEKQNE